MKNTLKTIYWIFLLTIALPLLSGMVARCIIYWFKFGWSLAL